MILIASVRGQDYQKLVNASLKLISFFINSLSYTYVLEQAATF